MNITLPSEWSYQDSLLLQTIADRRSCRDYSDQTVPLESLSRLLWSAQGINRAGKPNAPSAGAQYPVQVYVTAGRVHGLDVASYQYLPEPHQLRMVVDRDLRGELCEAALDHQPWVAEAAMVVLLSADLDAMSIHFEDQPPTGKRGERYVYLESGAIAQNVQLVAHSLNLGAVLVGGFDDSMIAGLFSLSPSRRATALICIGVP